MSSDREGGPWIWRATVTPVKDRTLKISGWARGKGVKTLVAICAQAWDAERKKMVGFATTQHSSPLAGDFEWTRIETRLNPPPEAKTVDVLLMLIGKGEVFYDDLSVEDVPLERIATGANRARPGIFELRGAFRVFQDGTYTFPVPLDYREQVPLTYELAATPRTALKKARLREDRPGNWVAEIEVERDEEPVDVTWRSLVLCAERDFSNVPKRAPIPATWPEETLPWLESTRCVQSADPRFVAIGRKLRASGDVIAIIASAIETARGIHEEQGRTKARARTLDAVAALVPPDYEDRSGARPSAAPGVPYLSLTEGALGTLGIVDPKHPACDHVAKQWTALERPDLERARARWRGWLAKGPTLADHVLATPWKWY